MQILQKEKKGFFAASNLLPVFVLISLALNGLALLIALLNSVAVVGLSNRPVPTLVQLEDGHSIAVEPVNHLHRTPTVIRLFVKDILSMMFTWNAASQGSGQGGRGGAVIADEGVGIDDARITTKSWQASFAFSEDFRIPFLTQVGAMTPKDVFTGNAQSVLNITSISNPTEIKKGKWQVDMVASLLIFDQQHPQGLSIPFNKTITVEAVEPLSDPLPNDASAIQRAVYRIRGGGLQITEMYELIQNQGR